MMNERSDIGHLQCFQCTTASTDVLTTSCGYSLCRACATQWQSLGADDDCACSLCEKSHERFVPVDMFCSCCAQKATVRVSPAYGERYELAILACQRAGELCTRCLFAACILQLARTPRHTPTCACSRLRRVTGLSITSVREVIEEVQLHDDDDDDGGGGERTSGWPDRLRAALEKRNVVVDDHVLRLARLLGDLRC